MRSKGVIEVVSFVQGHETSVYGYGFVIIAHEISCQPLFFSRCPLNCIVCDIISGGTRVARLDELPLKRFRARAMLGELQYIVRHDGLSNSALLRQWVRSRLPKSKHLAHDNATTIGEAM